MMTIYFGTDHAGYELKEVVLPFVRDELGYEVEDCGAYTYTDGDDYPDFIKMVAQKISKNPIERRGIILGGSGQGEAIVANRFVGVRATVYYGGNLDIITLSREHNDANILSLGARFLTVDEAKEAVEQWLTLPFSNEERHIRRIHSIDKTL